MSTGPVIPCLALLRVGVTEPPGSPRTLVRSYRTVSPLPDLRQRTSTAIGGLLSVALNRQVTPSWLSPAPCPVEPRLSSTWHATPRPPGRLTVGPRLPGPRAGDPETGHRTGPGHGGLSPCDARRRHLLYGTAGHIGWELAATGSDLLPWAAS